MGADLAEQALDLVVLGDPLVERDDHPAGQLGRAPARAG